MTRIRPKTRSEVVADKATYYAFLLETEGQNLEEQVPGILASDLACNTCNDPEVTTKTFLEYVAHWLRQLAEEIKMLR